MAVEDRTRSSHITASDSLENCVMFVRERSAFIVLDRRAALCDLSSKQMELVAVRTDRLSMLVQTQTFG